MKFLVSKRARRQIERIQKWWVTNRPAAKSLFLDELVAAEEALRANPELGAIYLERGPVRRVLLPRTHHLLFYRYRPTEADLTVLSVWGAVRGRLPLL